MGQHDTKDESPSSGNLTEEQDKGNNTTTTDTKDDPDGQSVGNKRDIQDVSTDYDDQQQNDSSSPNKKSRQEEEEEDAVTKARKVLEMFRREFGDDEEDDPVKKPTIETDESGKAEKTSDPSSVGDPASSRAFHRKPTILQDDDPCLL